MLSSESGSAYLKEQVAKFDNAFAAPPHFDHYELSAEAST
jgi:hypothetical protein